MAINISIYSNANASSRTVTFDFVGDVLAASYDGSFSPANSASVEYYFKSTANGTQDNGISFPVKIVRSLSELALNRSKQSKVNTSNAYSDIKSMVIDYTYDYINGHTADQWGSGVKSQNPMKF